MPDITGELSSFPAPPSVHHPFDALGPLVARVQGFNGTIFCYGQTGSGKTYTMEGEIDSEDKRGLLPRMVCAVFDYMERSGEHMQFMIQVPLSPRLGFDSNSPLLHSEVSVRRSLPHPRPLSDSPSPKRPYLVARVCAISLDYLGSCALLRLLSVFCLYKYQTLKN